MIQPPSDLAMTVRRALAEDVGPGDVTTRAVVPLDALGRGVIRTREALVVCGLPVAAECFAQVDPDLTFTPLLGEGARADANEDLAVVQGRLASILTAERLALNFTQRLSGVATNTARYVQALGGRPVRLVGTRKTTPGLRGVEKYAVRVGGAHNHRHALYDGVMIKDNHIAAAGSVAEAVRRARGAAHHLLAIQVEVENLAQATEAIDAGARVLLLDNFEPADLARVVARLRALGPELVLEASGGITLETLPAVAASGVDVISSGALVHQARWVDISLDLHAA